MLALERRNQIYEKLQQDKRVVVSELSQLYHVTEETIRRDLEKLEKDGIAIKSYGGAVLNENMNIELPFNVRKKHNVYGKQIIADLIAEMVHSREHLMLDSSSTSVFVAKALKEKEQLTIVTNSIEIMIELADKDKWNVISTGGSIKSGGLSLEGMRTIHGINDYNVEKVILSCKAFDIEKGFTDSSEDTVNVKRAMLKSGQERILAVDSSKFNKIAFCKIADLKDIDYLVTDKKPDEDIIKVLEQADINIIYPEK